MRRSPLHELVSQAGARFVARGGWEVASSYGPVAAEIAACRASAGIVDRSYVTKLELRAPAAALTAAIAEQIGAAPEPGTAQRRDGTWWCTLTPDWAFVLATRPREVSGEQLERALAADAGSVEDVTSALAAIELAGPRSRDVLARVTALEVPLAALPEGGFTPGPVARVQSMLLCARADRFLVLCPSDQAEQVWLALSEAGRRLGASHVGVDALDRLDAAPASVPAPF